MIRVAGVCDICGGIVFYDIITNPCGVTGGIQVVVISAKTSIGGRDYFIG